MARGIAEQLERTIRNSGLTRFVALPHTEGCGSSGGISEEIYLRTMAGYLSHSHVSRALVLEHGCEKTHNDAMRDFILEHGLDPQRFGWASIQLDGGLEKVTEKVAAFFKARSAEPRSSDAPISIGLIAAEAPSHEVAGALVRVSSAVLAAGGTVVIPGNSPILDAPACAELSGEPFHNTIGYGESFGTPGLHVMEAPTKHFVETLTGLGATGVDVIIAHVSDQPRQGHPLVPMIQIGAKPLAEVDMVGGSANFVDELLALLPRVIAGDYVPKAAQLGNTDFQMTRGLLGVSL